MKHNPTGLPRQARDVLNRPLERGMYENLDNNGATLSVLVLVLVSVSVLVLVIFLHGKNYQNDTNRQNDETSPKWHK